jgi:hypothetical protein
MLSNESPETQKEHTNEIDDSISDTQCAGRLHAASDILDRCAARLVSVGVLAFQLGKVFRGQVREAAHDVLVEELLRLRYAPLLRNLHLQSAPTKPKIENLLHAGRFGGWHRCFVLQNLVAAGDAQVDSSFPDEGRYVRGREEDQGNGQVLDQSDIKPAMAVEVDV